MEKTFKRPDGKRVKIEARVSRDGFSKDPFWYVYVSVCAPGKRSFLGVYDSDDYLFRGLNRKEKDAHVIAKQLAHATKEEIYEVMLLEWETLKPQPLL